MEAIRASGGGRLFKELGSLYLRLFVELSLRDKHILLSSVFFLLHRFLTKEFMKKGEYKSMEAEEILDLVKSIIDAVNKEEKWTLICEADVDSEGINRELTAHIPENMTIEWVCKGMELWIEELVQKGLLKEELVYALTEVLRK